MNWQDIVKTLAPTVATAVVSPLGGAAISALGSILGISDATQDKIASALQAGQLTPDQIAEIKKLELQYQENEKERGFRYSELAFKDRDSARKANVEGGTQRPIFWLSLALLAGTLGTEGWVLFNGLPPTVTDMVAGRVLGLMDAVALMVLTYWYGTSNGSAIKTDLLNQQGK